MNEVTEKFSTHSKFVDFLKSLKLCLTQRAMLLEATSCQNLCAN